MTEHEWFIERIAEALAGGLSGDEQSRFDAHRAACPTCAQEFAKLQQTEQSMTQLFADVIPGADFEQRLLSRLRFSNPLRIHPIAKRAAIAASVALALGGIGYVANHLLESGALDPNHLRVASNLDQFGPATTQPAADNKKIYLGYGFTDGNGEVAQNVTYGDKHVEFQQNPFTGVARDNIFNRDRFQQIARAPSQLTTDDSVLLPSDEDSNGAKVSEPDLTGRMYEVGRNKLLPEQNPTAGPVSPAPINAPVAAGEYYMGGRVTTSGTYSLGTRSIALNATNAAVGGTNLYWDTKSKDLTDFFYRPNQPDAAEVKQLQETERLPVLRPAGQEVALADKEKVVADGDVTGKPVATPAPAEATTPAPGTETAPPTTQPISRKVIRNGTVEFEIDSFDSASMTIHKIVDEEGGYVATTNSEKLPNGKVKGTIVVRIPPDHLDTLVLKLRGLGDLKSQNLTADDVTKQYTDTASELRAAEAMQERLLDIIKKSQGQIKDLLAAEKELATWREKIEKLEGEIRYYDNLVALSTLNISLYERDIKQADVLKETESVDMGVETDNVEDSRASAIKAIDDAKGRIVESELKKLDAGQLAAKVVADLPPDSAGPAIDRLKQLGKVARLEVHREQKSPTDQPATSNTKLERGETHIILSLYNLANVAPRQTTAATLAASDVEQAYHAILKLADDAGGRIVTSNLQRLTDQQIAGDIQLEIKSADADATLDKLRADGEITHLAVTENPDTANVTTAKRGFSVHIVSMASLQPREVNNRNIATSDVDRLYQSLLQILRASKARIIVSRVEDQDKGAHNAYLDFEIPRSQLAETEKAIAAAGETFNRSVDAAADAENVTDSKVQFKLAISPASSLPVRQTDSLAIESTDVDAAAQSFQGSATSAGGRVIDANFTKDEQGQTARIIVEVPFSATSQIVAETKHLGTVRGSQQSTNQQAPSGELARARIELTLASPDVLVTPEHGVMATLRSGLATSFAGLMWSLELIVIGLCLVAPWGLLVWLGVKLIRRARGKTVTT
jgi:hypothetical protein